VSGENQHAICRLDQDSVGTHGWLVRLQRRGVRVSRFFSDATWGGYEAALSKAQHFRDRIVAGWARQDQARVISRQSHTLPAARNRSGVVGVTEIVQRSPGGGEYRFWQASWTDQQGRRISVRYSVLRYGASEAFRLACVARREAGG
jgi:AP2 domain